MPDRSLIKRLKILDVTVETDNARTFLLEPLDGWQPKYKAGQFLTIVFYTPHGEKRRSFSMTSSFELGEPLRITVKKIDNGEFSRPLVYNAKPGDMLYTSGISGLFVLPENPGNNNFCFLAAGSGITPCFALIKTLLFKADSKIILFYSNKNKEETIFHEQLLVLQKKFPERLTIRFMFSNHPDLKYKRMSKWLLEQLLNEYLITGMDKTLFYLCGPFDYMQMSEIVLMNKIPRQQIIKENFTSFPRLILPEPPDKRMHRVTIHINNKTHVLNVQFPKSILKTAKEHQIELPYSCEAGRCASCIATCTRGKIWMAYNEVLVDKEIEKGRVLTCQGFPVDGDAEINFDALA